MFLFFKNSVLISKAMKGQLICPDFPDFCQDIEALFEKVKNVDSGACASYIPALAQQDPSLWAVAVCTIDGQVLFLLLCCFFTPKKLCFALFSGIRYWRLRLQVLYSILLQTHFLPHCCPRKWIRLCAPSYRSRTKVTNF